MRSKSQTLLFSVLWTLGSIGPFFAAQAWEIVRLFSPQSSSWSSYVISLYPREYRTIMLLALFAIMAGLGYNLALDMNALYNKVKEYKQRHDKQKGAS